MNRTFGPNHCVQAALPYLEGKVAAVILNVGSIAGKTSAVGFGHYPGQACLHNLTPTSKDLARSGIRSTHRAGVIATPRSRPRPSDALNP